MRLGQLARKLAIRPSQLVDYLSTRQIYFEEGSNAKLSDEYVRDIVTHFAPDRLTELLAIQKEEAEAETRVVQEVLPELPAPETLQAAESHEIVQEESQEKPEVIRAPKVELSGLKVVGKIELPQPKKKETSSEPSSTESSPEMKREDRPRQKHKKVERKGRSESWQNPIAMQREREAREREAQRRAAIERAKEKKKEHYLKRVKGGQPTKPARISDEPTEHYESAHQQVKPRSWWGRFMHWLNS